MKRNDWLTFAAALGFAALPFAAYAQDANEIATDAAPAVNVAAEENVETQAAPDSAAAPQTIQITLPADTASNDAVYDVYVVKAETVDNAGNTPIATIPDSEPEFSRETLLGSGFAAMLNIGPYYAFKDELHTSGDRRVHVPTAGLEASVDLGFKGKYFGAFAELMFRGGAAMEDDVHYHCPMNSFKPDDICFAYNSINKGDWDTYYMGIGLMVAGYIPVASRVFLSLGAGIIGYFGRTIDGDEAAFNYALKGSLGINFALNRDIALGLAINYEGLMDHRQSIQPAFSLIYGF